MKITLNLMPPIKKKGLQKALFLAFFQTLSILMFVVSMALVGILLLVRNQMLASFQQLKQRSAIASSGTAATIMSDIKQTNLFLKDTAALQASFIPWADVTERITALIPPRARLESLEFAADGGVRLRGYAATREDAMAMLGNFKAAPFLTDVISPLSNILQKENVSFDFSMKYVLPASAAK